MSDATHTCAPPDFGYQRGSDRTGSVMVLQCCSDLFVISVFDVMWTGEPVRYVINLDHLKWTAAKCAISGRT